MPAHFLAVAARSGNGRISLVTGGAKITLAAAARETRFILALGAGTPGTLNLHEQSLTAPT